LTAEHEDRLYIHKDTTKKLKKRLVHSAKEPKPKKERGEYDDEAYAVSDTVPPSQCSFALQSPVRRCALPFACQLSAHSLAVLVSTATVHSSVYCQYSKTHTHSSGLSTRAWSASAETSCAAGHRQRGVPVLNRGQGGACSSG
jgi:hypothetical protein